MTTRPAQAPALRHTGVGSPIGPLTLVADVDDVLLGVYMDGHRPAPRPERLGHDVPPSMFAEVVRQLDEYFAGRRRAFDLETRAVGTPFQRAIWDALAAVPYGSTVSYGELADAIGRPAAVRAVGAAVGRNPLTVVVPCHRVIGTDGALTGYAGGLDRKRFLLALERGDGA